MRVVAAAPEHVEGKVVEAVRRHGEGLRDLTVHLDGEDHVAVRDLVCRVVPGALARSAVHVDDVVRAAARPARGHVVVVHVGEAGTWRRLERTVREQRLRLVAAAHGLERGAGGNGDGRVEHVEAARVHRSGVECERAARVGEGHRAVAGLGHGGVRVEARGDRVGRSRRRVDGAVEQDESIAHERRAGGREADAAGLDLAAHRHEPAPGEHGRRAVLPRAGRRAVQPRLGRVVPRAPRAAVPHKVLRKNRRPRDQNRHADQLTKHCTPPLIKVIAKTPLSCRLRARPRGLMELAKQHLHD